MENEKKAAAQLSMTDMEYSCRKRKTKRDEFLEIMEAVIPWEELAGLIVPYYPEGKRGRPVRGIITMLRMYLLQEWFNLADEATEEAIYDSYAFRKFMKLNFTKESVPDATTLLKFRRLIVDNGIADMLFKAIKDFLTAHGRMMRGGTIVDATIIESPTSTKNAEKKRDAEMHSAKKGNQWHFGSKLHIGVDMGSGLIHTAVITAANVHDVTAAAQLIREDDEVCGGDSGYVGLADREEIKNDKQKSRIEYRINKRPKSVTDPTEKQIERRKCSIRAKVEYAFYVIKRIFKYTKNRYRGLKKNAAQQIVLCGLANLWMERHNLIRLRANSALL